MIENYPKLTESFFANLAVGLVGAWHQTEIILDTIREKYPDFTKKDYEDNFSKIWDKLYDYIGECDNCGHTYDLNDLQANEGLICDDCYEEENE